MEILGTVRSLRYLRSVEPDVELFAEADQYRARRLLDTSRAK